ncbi:MAG: MBL fold metallo-hydrolase [Sedimentisphaerales bacterium]|nr:MBL fold metallo-hydrolase [Sedimentisphaerales bacterium]
MKRDISITVLVTNTVFGPKFKAEHGLSLWIEYGGKRILFDTGQSNLLFSNAGLLDVDLTKADAVILSHGHYDHTGGLNRFLKIVPDARVYLHPKALDRKFSQKDGRIREIGMQSSTRHTLLERVREKTAVETERPTVVFPGVTVTGQIPRISEFEHYSGDFYLDRPCRTEDSLMDDQAMVLDLDNGAVVVLGCCHAGIINTLQYIRTITSKRISAVIGGMHLSNASESRVKKTVSFLNDFNIEMMAPMHCTGFSASVALKNAFRSEFVECPVGYRLHLPL